MEEVLSSTRIRIAASYLPIPLPLLFLCRFPLSTVACQLSSVLPLQDKIGERSESARKFGISVAVEASLRAACIILRQRTGASKRSGFMNQRNDCFGAHGNKFLFREHARDKFTRIAVAIFHRVDQRQSDLAFFQIAKNRFAKLFRRGREIQQVIYKLKRQTCISS